MIVPFFRPGTDDDRFVIPEVVDQDMYRLAELPALLGRRQGAILDGGAHIGACAVMLAKHFPDSLVQAYEPEPGNFELLVANAAPYPNIRAHQAALDLDEGEAVLWPQDGTGRYSMTPWAPSGELLRVRALSLEAELRRCAPVLILKLDLEGYEARLLNGLSFASLQAVEMLILETHPWVGDRLDEARLAAAGFAALFHPYGDPRHTVYLRKG